MLPQPNKTIIKILGSFCLRVRSVIFNRSIISKTPFNNLLNSPFIQVTNQVTNDFATLVWKPQPLRNPHRAEETRKTLAKILINKSKDK